MEPIKHSKVYADEVFDIIDPSYLLFISELKRKRTAGVFHRVMRRAFCDALMQHTNMSEQEVGAAWHAYSAANGLNGAQPREES